MIFKNGLVFHNNDFVSCDIKVKGTLITDIGTNIDCNKECNEEIVDCTNMLVLPGMVDIHTHGCVGYDFSNASVSDILQMKTFYAKHGITSVVATTMTMPKDDYRNAMTVIKNVIEGNSLGADIVGINMEGPFLGVEKKGAHDERYLTAPEFDYFEELDSLSGGNIVMVDVDPDYDNALSFIRKYSKNKVISLAHTSCGYDKAVKAFDSGAMNITHLFNAMNTLHHRDAGLVGALSDYAEKGITAELICDGFHIDAPVIRLIFKLCGENINLISDSMCAAGLTGGEYLLGGIPVFVEKGKATQKDGVIAGSTANVFDCMVRAIKYGVPVNKALNSATSIPSKTIGLDKKIGCISTGLDADILIVDKNYNLNKVYLKGKMFK